VAKGRKHDAFQQLTSDELQKIEIGVNELEASLKGGDYKIIRNAIERLDKATRRFAELMMDSAVAGAMTGQTMAAAGESLGSGPTAPHPFAKAQIDDSVRENEIERLEHDPLTAENATED
jgi:molecular chaperone DnaK/molecular chaperone HscA